MTFTFEHHLKALVYLHLQEYDRPQITRIKKMIFPA